MANTFNINIITKDGASLIAQATATNQIVIVDALSSTYAATDAADLASKTVAFYNGISGDIQACSATDNVAKIVTRFINAGASEQIVKSVAIRGKLANQNDVDAVIMAAMSDPASEIYFPSNASPSQIVRFIFNFAVNADSDVETTYADGASVSDLDRFVSMHKAGDPTVGEAQTILGDKTFTGDVKINILSCDSVRIVYSGSNYASITSTLGDFFFDGDLMPSSNRSLDLGATSYMWRHAYVQDLQFDGLEGTDPDHVQLYEDDGDVWIQPASSGKVAIGKPGSLCNISAHNANLNNVSCQDIIGVDCNLRDIVARDIDATTLQGVLETLYKATPEAGSIAEIELVNANGSDTSTITMIRGDKVYNLMEYSSKTINVLLDGSTTSSNWMILNKVSFSNASAKVLAVMVNDDV